jgi:hypothetical protein
MLPNTCSEAKSARCWLLQSLWQNLPDGLVKALLVCLLGGKGTPFTINPFLWRARCRDGQASRSVHSFIPAEHDQCLASRRKLACSSSRHQTISETHSLTLQGYIKKGVYCTNSIRMYPEDLLESRVGVFQVRLSLLLLYQWNMHNPCPFVKKKCGSVWNMGSVRKLGQPARWREAWLGSWWGTVKRVCASRETDRQPAGESSSGFGQEPGTDDRSNGQLDRTNRRATPVAAQSRMSMPGVEAFSPSPPGFGDRLERQPHKQLQATTSPTH